jgi:Kip1 ubiquitination-promoting complex protein 1
VAASFRAKYLLGSLQQLVQLGSREVAAAMAPVERLKMLSHFQVREAML